MNPFAMLVGSLFLSMCFNIPGCDGTIMGMTAGGPLGAPGGIPRPPAGGFGLGGGPLAGPIAGVFDPRMGFPAGGYDPRFGGFDPRSGGFDPRFPGGFDPRIARLPVAVRPLAPTAPATGARAAPPAPRAVAPPTPARTATAPDSPTARPVAPVSGPAPTSVDSNVPSEYRFTDPAPDYDPFSPYFIPPVVDPGLNDINT